jgi:AraC-like DNA-binding protein
MLQTDPESFMKFVLKIGYEIGGDMEQKVRLHDQRAFDALPELAMFIASYTVTKTFFRPTSAPRAIEDCLCFYFKNIVGDDPLRSKTRSSETAPEAPRVHVFPATQSFISHFRKGAHVNVVSIFISAGYLRSFLNQDAGLFPFLFDRRSDFLIEEILTDDILRSLDEVVKIKPGGVLSSFRTKMKAMELLMHLLSSLGKRQQTVHQRLSAHDITAIYRVRDRLIASLSVPASISELKRIAAMNELKMRRIFTQVFGRGIYDYHQHLRMLEAARLLRQEQLQVSDAGYRLGFENLSHFSRLFERHIGIKPKKYSMVTPKDEPSGKSGDEQD